MTTWQIAKPETANANTDKTFYVISNGFEYTTNLAIDSLSEDNTQVDGRRGVKSHKTCSLTVEKDSPQQFRRECWIP
jgi:hypothetical protein